MRVEQLDGEAGDVDRVRRVVVAAIDELADAAPRDVAEVVDLATPPRRRLIVSSSTPSRSAASEYTNDATSNVSAIVARISAPATMMSARSGVEAGDLRAAPSAVRCLTSSGDDIVERLVGDLEAVVRPQRLGAGRRVGDAGDRLGGARRGDGDLEAVRGRPRGGSAR